MTQANPFAAFQAQQPQAANPAAFGGQPLAQPAAAANPFGAQPASPPQNAGAFGAPPATAAAPAFAGSPPDLGGGGFGSGMPDLSDVSEAGGRLPEIPVGTHLLLFTKNYVKTRKGHSVLIDWKVLQTDNPNMPQGSDVSLFQKISNDPDKRGTGLGKILSCVRALLGFADEAAFKADPAWKNIFAAVIAGQAAPWQTRKVWCLGIRGDEKVDPKRPGVSTGQYWVNYQWAPAA